MKIRVRTSILTHLRDKLAVKHPLVLEALRYSPNPDSLRDVDLSRLPDDVVAKLAEAAKANAGTDTTATGVMRKASAYLALKSDPTAKPVGSCQTLEMALKALIARLPDKRLYREQDGHWLPYLAESVRYHEATRDNPAHTCVQLVSSHAGDKRKRTVEWEYHELRGQRTAEELLADKGYVVQNDELDAAHAAAMAKFAEVHPRTGEQYAATGTGLTGYYGSGRFMEVEGQPSKVVVDHLWDEKDERECPHVEHAADTSFWDRLEAKLGDRDDADPEAGQHLTVPVHPYVSVFRLEDHQHYDVHAADLSPWPFDPTLPDKLVLDPEKKELVDLLVTSASAVLEDIVAGKTGGVIVAASGPPGTGKTLTAECYAEHTRRPLYTVQCSQLGTNEGTVELKLKTVLNRATRWKAILLIDEADVYVRARGEDIHQNAIVGVFLRTLERYRGILFLTTNRATTIDDAILSRLTAHVRYELPDAAARKRIWEVLAANYGVEFAPGALAKVADEHAVSGRTVKNLLKLLVFRLKRKPGYATPGLVRELLGFIDHEGKEGA